METGSALPMPKEELYVLLTCRLCGVQIVMLQQHLRNVHKVSCVKYRALFPGERFVSRWAIEQQHRRQSAGDLEMVECRVCDQAYRMINGRHLAFHGMAVAEYRKMYPGSPMKTA